MPQNNEVYSSSYVKHHLNDRTPGFNLVTDSKREQTATLYSAIINSRFHLNGRTVHRLRRSNLITRLKVFLYKSKSVNRPACSWSPPFWYVQ